MLPACYSRPLLQADDDDKGSKQGSRQKYSDFCRPTLITLVKAANSGRNTMDTCRVDPRVFPT
eukprot:3438113-Amphidinium_carterae.1